MIRIRTPSRLHFGLLSIPGEEQEGQSSIPRRHFGGAGLMIERPGIELTLDPAPGWSAQGPLAERALAFAKSYCAAAGIDASFHLRILAAAPEHAGLGTGTQLGLAVARALAEWAQAQERDAVSLARLVGRGRRSAIGVHGFEHGGFLVEAGKNAQTAIGPLLGRWDFPADWCVLLVLPHASQGMHGVREIDAFAELARRHCEDRTTEILSRILLLGLIPALLEGDLQTFGAALYDYNRRVGERFQAAQGGVYADPRGAEIIKTIRGLGVAGVGQSSWGPAIFAVVHNSDAAALGARLATMGLVGPDEMILTRACNRGATLSALPAVG